MWEGPVESVPGSSMNFNFLSFISDSQAGILRIWNVSKSTSMTNIKLKMTGFHSLIVVEPSQSMSPTNNNDHSFVGLSSTSAASEAPSSPNQIAYALPPARILCTFLDGGVGLYDLGKRKWSFLRDMVSLVSVSFGIRSNARVIVVLLVK